MKATADKKKFLCNLSWSQATFIVLLGTAGFFHWTEHKAHLLGALPFLIFLLCPLMHVFMHKGNGGRPGGGNDSHNHKND